MLFAELFCLIAGLAVSLFGFGSMTQKAFGLPRGQWPLTVSIGLAIWLFIGGILNLLHIAYPVTIYVLVAIGCLVAARSFINFANASGASSTQVEADRHGYWIPWLVASAIFAFIFFTQAMPTAFNHHDDYQKYFAHVARMIQTGTAAGSSMNVLGSETLGGQAFLQEYFVAFLPWSAINAADAVFCFGLLLALLAGITGARPGLKWVAVLLMLLLLVFEPQYVSVTALYSAAAMIFALIILSVDQREYPAGQVAEPVSAITGLFYAALVALKPTFGLFAAAHLISCFAAEAFAGRSVVRPLKRAALATAWAAVFIAPWVVLYGPLYLGSLFGERAALINAGSPLIESIDLFSLKSLFYGGTYALYTFAAFCPLICFAIAFRLSKNQPDNSAVRLGAICVAVALTYLALILVFGPLLAGYETALRHVIPVLIGAVPACLMLIAIAGQVHSRSVAAIAAGCLIVFFIPDSIQRFGQLLHTGTMLSYMRNWPQNSVDDLLAVSRDTLDGSVGQQIADIQNKIPAGAPLLVWNAAPFLLNFGRNPIIDIDIGGFGTPWSTTPKVPYVLWQHNGFGVRQPKDYAHRLAGVRETYINARGFLYAKGLQETAAKSTVLSADDKNYLFLVGAGVALP